MRPTQTAPKTSPAALSLCGLLAVAACAPTTGYGPLPPPGPVPNASVFRAADFDWSTRAGQGGIDGRVAYRRDGQAYDCTGSVALTPDTPYTRARFRTLYGSTDQAAVPEAIVRARTVSDPNADYRSYVRSATCSGGRFSFSGLPDGGWFVIVPVSAGGDNRVVLMRHVDTRGRRVAVTL